MAHFPRCNRTAFQMPLDFLRGHPVGSLGKEEEHIEPSCERNRGMGEDRAFLRMDLMLPTGADVRKSRPPKAIGVLLLTGRTDRILEAQMEQKGHALPFAAESSLE